MLKTLRVIIILACLLELFSPFSNTIRPIRAASSLTATPSSAGAGTMVRMIGSGFTAASTTRAFWGTNTAQAPVGIGYTGYDGKLYVNLTIPANATTGLNTITVQNTTLYGSSPSESVTIDLTVTAPARKALYIYNNSQSTANAYKALLDANGIATTVMALSDININTSFSAYNLIIIGWNNPTLTTDWIVTYFPQYLALAKTGKPILAMGSGGVAFLDVMGKLIGLSHSLFTASSPRILPQNPRDDLYKTPYVIPAPGEGMDLYNGPWNCWSVVLPSSTAVYPYARLQGSSSGIHALVQQGRFFLWGYSGGVPTDMTTTGKNLLVNAAWHMMGVLSPETLVLTNTQQLHTLGYLDVDSMNLSASLIHLTGLPFAQSNMHAIWKDLAKDGNDAIVNGYFDWNAINNDPLRTELLALSIDNYIEYLKHAVYPNLKYVILVGSHEVIPMALRPADRFQENVWSIPDGNLKSLVNTGSNGLYLTDSIYRDLSYKDNDRGDDNVLVPELAVGRLVETPNQISDLVDVYIASNGTMSRAKTAAIGSNDFMDGASFAKAAMIGTSRKTIILPSFSSNLVPTTLNSNHGVVYIAGHGNFNWITTQKDAPKSGFMAGFTADQGNTEDLNNLDNAVIVAAGCHNGVVFPNKT